MPDTFDLVVIGGGPGGYTAAIRAAQLGLRVACIEKRKNKALGGTCLNIGCIPSKALLDSSELYEVISHKAKKHGIGVTGVSLDIPAMMGRKNKVVKELTDGVAYLFKKYKVTAYYGAGKMVGPGKVSVTDAGGAVTELAAKHVLLATGSDTTELPFLKFDGSTVVSSTEALDFQEVPKHLIVVGAGYIGLELGSVWKRLGAKVSVIEFLPRILPISDAGIAADVYKILARQGLEFHLNTKVTGATVNKGILGGTTVTVNAEDKDGKALTFEGDKVLVCVGRRAHTANLGLDEMGVEFDRKTGKVKADLHFHTNIEGVSAIGDLIDGPMLAHKASEEGLVFAEQLAGQKPHLNYDTIPSVIYIWPEVASVGFNEEQLKEAGTAYKVGKVPFLASGRAKAMDEPDGYVKVLTDATTDRLLGVHILGPRASDLIAECVTVMEYHGSAEDIARCTHAHPTLGETVGDAARMAYAGLPVNF